MIGYDSDNLDLIPDNIAADPTILLLYYADGEPGSATDQQLSRFITPYRQSITRRYGTPGYWGDCEAGALTIPQSIGMWQQGQIHGIYVDESDWPTVEAATNNLIPPYWIAQYPIPAPTIPVVDPSWIARGCVMWQYADPDTGSGGHWDLSVTAPGFPVAGTPTPPPPPYSRSLLLIGS